MVDRVLFGLSETEEAELRSLCRGEPFDLGLELAATATHLALLPEVSPMPAQVRDRLMKQAAAYRPASEPARHPSAEVSFPRQGEVPQPLPFQSASPRVPGWGWFAAAACLVLAVAGWWPRLIGPPAQNQARVIDLGAQRNALLASPGAVKGEWIDWALEGEPPEIAGVKGDVVFDPATQSGFMRFVGLPSNGPDEQYQLWIIDERGLGQRVSGAIFDARGGGELIVPIAPRITVGRPALFAVTIERAGGTWVSDMKRRVVAAAISG